MPLVSLFVRPSNITTSTLLQTLSIMAHLARRSGNQLTYVQAPRVSISSMQCIASLLFHAFLLR